MASQPSSLEWPLTDPEYTKRTNASSHADEGISKKICFFCVKYSNAKTVMLLKLGQQLEYCCAITHFKSSQYCTKLLIKIGNIEEAYTPLQKESSPFERVGKCDGNLCKKLVTNFYGAATNCCSPGKIYHFCSGEHMCDLFKLMKSGTWKAFTQDKAKKKK